MGKIVMLVACQLHVAYCKPALVLKWRTLCNPVKYELNRVVLYNILCLQITLLRSIVNVLNDLYPKDWTHMDFILDDLSFDQLHLEVNLLSRQIPVFVMSCQIQANWTQVMSSFLYPLQIYAQCPSITTS